MYTKKERGKYTVYLKRKVDTFLREWKADPARKPLIIKGSRQVGKTESIRKFAAEEYESVVEINFVRDEKYKGITLPRNLFRTKRCFFLMKLPNFRKLQHPSSFSMRMGGLM